MPVIELNALDENEVASRTSFEVLTGGERWLIMSGVAIPKFWTNHDEEVNYAQIVVKLGEYATGLKDAVAHIGLASFTGEETDFQFAIGEQVVEIDNGQLQLRVNSAILGEHAVLHRFGYQIVAHVTRVRAKVSGTITVPKAIADVENASDAEIGSMLQITASTITMQEAPPGGYATEKQTPVAAGVTTGRRSSPSANLIDYEVDGCPYNTPIRVEVKLAGALAITGVAAGQTAGPLPVVLSSGTPEVSGVDFAVSRIPDVH